MLINSSLNEPQSLEGKYNYWQYRILKFDTNK